MSSEPTSENDPTLDRTIIPAASRTTIIGRMSSRRRWTAEQKLAIVAASYDPGSNVQEVAYRFEVSPAQIYNWRKQGSGEPLDPTVPMVASFARVEVADRASSPISQLAGSSMIEIRFGNETTIVVGDDVNENALRRVLAAFGR